MLSMRLRLAAFALACTTAGYARQPSVVLRPGMVITHSIRVTPRTYRFSSTGDSAVITIRGSNITVDFSGATLLGSRPGADPDTYAGIAIRVDGGSNVTIENVKVHGYKLGLLASGIRTFNLFDSNFSDNWKPRLFSVVEHESLVDWLSHHHDEKDEWLRFGAGVYLRDVRGGVVRGIRIEHGMEGLMLVRTDSMSIWNNTIRFNSGVGIGLYRSSYNSIMHNYASFNVRGFSQGFYRRGQDSADLLMYEQSSHNVVAYNSMTHGGDGLFLWAGQSTMDTGEGGANDNLFFRNDFSYAPTNAMEATFSRNAIIENRANGSEYGLWGGYSYNSDVQRNEFKGNRTGIAIEHGQENQFEGNTFDDDSTGISLWAIPEQPSDWGYPKHRDTRSRDNVIVGNRFEHNRVGIRIANTVDSRMNANSFSAVDSTVVYRDSTRLATEAPTSSVPHDYSLPSKRNGGFDPNADPLAKLPRSAIIVDEWGPYDWRTPKLWPADSSTRTPLPLRVLGPSGTWHVIATKGVAHASSQRGRMNDTLVVTPETGQENDWRIVLQSDRGRVFSYERFQPISGWSVDFVPNRKPGQRDFIIAHRDEKKLDYMWYRPPLPNVPQDSFRILATAAVDLSGGTYTLRTISDDAIRVWIDDALVIDDWTPHESKVDNVPIKPGRHALRVEYAQVDGWLELRVEIVRGVQTSEGSPPPH